MELKLKEIRLIRHMTQHEVAEYLHCSDTSYSRYESGERSPAPDMLVKMADRFDVTLDYLLDRQHISAKALTPYETELVEASRKADERAKSDALKLLLEHISK